jgi:hypothetical protein
MIFPVVRTDAASDELSPRGGSVLPAPAHLTSLKDIVRSKSGDTRQEETFRDQPSKE